MSGWAAKRFSRASVIAIAEFFVTPRLIEGERRDATKPAHRRLRRRLFGLIYEIAIIGVPANTRVGVNVRQVRCFKIEPWVGCL